MKTFYAMLAAVLLFASCSNDDDGQTQKETPLIGEWRLVATYADPGDGSGDFETINSSKTVQFESNASFSANADLCNVFSEVGGSYLGIFSESEGTITMSDCSTVPLNFELIDSNLIINYTSCIEGCKEKYEKLD